MIVIAARLSEREGWLKHGCLQNYVESRKGLLLSIMHFEWDLKKTAANKRKHGVSFEEATSSLRDPFSATAHDPDHSIDEVRFISYGISSSERLLMVSHTERGNAIRIISARLATKTERKIYEEG